MMVKGFNLKTGEQVVIKKVPNDSESLESELYPIVQTV